MREIKFKRYYKNDVTGEVVSRIWGCVDYRSESNIDFSSFASPSYVHGFRPIADCQFTGLRDKNGKEIYESDVLKSFHFNDGHKDHYLYHEVKWSEIYLCWVAVSVSNTSDDLIQGNPQLWVYVKNTQFEVCGNIYQHPELLKPTQK